MKPPRRRNCLIALSFYLGLLCLPLPAYAQDSVIHLPLIQGPPAPPAITIVSPFAGSSVGGVFVFAVDVTSAAPIERVEFRAGAAVLGEDFTGDDGFSIFVDSRNLPSGQTLLSAVASGPGGQGADDVIVQLVPDPPTSGITTANGGGVFATETGSVISLRPGSALPNQPITVDELTQAEVTEQHNIDWEAMGVTFLGAQEIRAETPITLPLAGVTSAGFAESVQPGQVIVNYRLHPDADGDGVSEIVVVNTAAIEPNGDIVADAVSRPIVLSGAGVSAAATLSGPPGFLLDIPVRGFNVHGGRSNRAVFTTLTQTVEVDGSVYVDPARPTQQIFRVAIPYMQPGAATLVLRNETVFDAAEPLALTIEPLPALTRPADQVFAELFDTYAQAIARKMTTLPADAEPVRLSAVLKAGEELTNELAQLHTAYSDLYAQLNAASIPEPAVRAEVDKVIGHMNRAAAMVEVNGVAHLAAAWLHTPLTVSALTDCRQAFTSDNPTDSMVDFVKNLITSPYVGNSWVDYAIRGLTAAEGVAVAVNASAATFNTLGALEEATGAVVTTEAATTLKSHLFHSLNHGLEYANQQNNEDCPQHPPPPPCPPGQSNIGPTGMGSSLPHGGNGCGVVGLNLSVAQSSAGDFSPRRDGTFSLNDTSHVKSPALSLAGRIAVKIYVNGRATPFSGLTDAGGYFFVPFIPEGEPFTAIAFDRASGQTRSYTGFGPRTGDSSLFFFDFSAPNEAGITWDGGGDGTSWADARNWDADRIPAEDDRAVIGAAPGRTVVITDSVDVVSLQSAADLVLDGGILKVHAASNVNAAFTIAPEGELRVEGATARFTVNGATAISGTVWAFQGGQVILPSATVLNGDTDDFAEVIAVGEGSAIDLSGVTTILGNTRTGPSGSVFYYPISAIGGGRVNLSSLAAISAGRIQATSSGEGSLLDFANLVDLGDRSKLVAAERGRISLPRAANWESTSVDLSTGGLISVTQVVTLTRGFVVVTGDRLTFPNVTHIDAAAFAVYEGGELHFPAVTAFTGTEDAVITKWYARDAGSRLSFPAMQTLRGNSFVNSALLVTAQDGAQVDLPQLGVVDGGKVQFAARGAGSVIDLTELTAFARSGRGDASLAATEGGRILSPNLVDLNGVLLTVNAGAGLDTSQIVTLTSGGIDVMGVIADFANLRHVDGASLMVRDGGVLALPKVTAYAGDGLDFFTLLRAEGVGSLLDLSAVTALMGNTFNNDALLVQAVDGGSLRLPKLTAIDVGKVQFDATGDGSVIDLALLRDFRRSGTGHSWLRAGDDGAFDLGDGVLRLEHVDLFVEPQSIYTLSSLLIEEGARLLGSNRFVASVVNRGEVAPALIALYAQEAGAIHGAGTLQIEGSYTQSVTGTLVIEIAGPLPVDYDRLAVDGPVQLGGTLSLALLGGYVPAPGTSFTVLSGASVTGVFDEVTGAELDENRHFEVTYGVESVVVTVEKD